MTLVRSCPTAQQGRQTRGFRMAREELTRLTGNGNGECGEDDCPNVYRTERGTFVVQGDVSSAFAPPQGEGLVEIPESVLREAVRALGW
ncbi:hypothetical protein GCM10010330_63230 [Streptomyces tendae]|nr:hypothetical protein GCM10010330_63230 [Streptomyces tendae]